MPDPIPDTGVVVDPGSKYSAYVEFRFNARSLSGFDVVSFGKVPNDEMRELLRRGFDGMLVVEMPKPRGVPTSSEEMVTMVHIGRFIQVWSARGGRWSFSFREYVKLYLCGRVFKITDSNVRRALIDLFGGEDEAIGGKKCSKCKGSGVHGYEIVTCPECAGAGEVPAKKAGQTKKCPTCHGRKTVKGERATCDVCRGQKWQHPPGQLFGIAEDVWAALGVAALWADSPIVVQQLGSSQAAKLKKAAKARAEAIKAEAKNSGRPEIST